jgi:hypothetical protein
MAMQCEPGSLGIALAPLALSRSRRLASIRPKNVSFWFATFRFYRTTQGFLYPAASYSPGLLCMIPPSTKTVVAVM